MSNTQLNQRGNINSGQHRYCQFRKLFKQIKHSRSMNFLKRWWVWFLAIFLVLIVVYRLLSDDHFLQYTENFLIFGLPIFTFLGLVLNIKKTKMKFATDWVFWVWLILFLLSLINVYAGIFSPVSSKS